MDIQGNERAQLLQRILASRYFVNSETLKRVLRYVAQHSQEPDGPALSEYEIAVSALGRRDSFDPKLDPIVRVSMTSIRQRLNSYFEAEGGREALRLKISKGHYRAVYEPNERSRKAAPGETVRGEAAGRSVARFWRSYFDGGFPNILVHSEPLFLRDDKGTRIRHIHLNNPETAPQQIKEIWPELDGASFLPYYAYLSVGMVYCMLAVTRVFHEAGIAIDLKSARSCAWQELRQSNLILVGNVGANAYLDALQGGADFILAEDFVRNARPRAGERERYSGERYMDGKLARHREYAVITRRPGLAPGSAITMIGALHGKALEGAGQFLTSEDRLRGLLEHLQPNSREAVPDYFQVLMEVEMIDIGDEVVNVNCVANRVICAPPRVNLSS